MPDVLDNLKPYFDSLSEEDEEKLDELHSIFQNDFCNNPFSINGINVKVKIHPYNHKKDNLPEHFSRYYEKFVHVITRKINNNKGNKKREFIEERANRIHWMRPILENHTDKRITYFQSIENDGTIRDYFWFKAKKYIVILEEVLPDYILITGFCVDNKNYSYFLRKEKNGI